MSRRSFFFHYHYIHSPRREPNPLHSKPNYHSGRFSPNDSLVMRHSSGTHHQENSPVSPWRARKQKINKIHHGSLNTLNTYSARPSLGTTKLMTADPTLANKSRSGVFPPVCPFITIFGRALSPYLCHCHSHCGAIPNRLLIYHCYQPVNKTLRRPFLKQAIFRLTRQTTEESTTQSTERSAVNQSIVTQSTSGCQFVSSTIWDDVLPMRNKSLKKHDAKVCQFKSREGMLTQKKSKRTPEDRRTLFGQLTKWFKYRLADWWRCRCENRRRLRNSWKWSRHGQWLSLGSMTSFILSMRNNRDDVNDAGEHYHNHLNLLHHHRSN